jgi:hypothetical protein
MQALEHEYSSVIEVLVQMASCLKPMTEEGELATSPAVSNAIPKIKAPIYDGSDELALVTTNNVIKYLYLCLLYFKNIYIYICLHVSGSLAIINFNPNNNWGPMSLRGPRRYNK